MANRNICSCLCRGQTHINSFMCIHFGNKAKIAATSFASVKYSAFMRLVMVHWGGGFWAERCWVVLWTPKQDFGCITSHAQRTAATYFIGSWKSEVVRIVVVCWAFLLQSFGVAQIAHTRWPTEIFARVCVKVKPISTLFMCISIRDQA